MIDPNAPYAHYWPMPLKHEKPNSRLMAELLEVRSAAEALKKLISRTSGLPNEFPLGPFESMLLSLIGLPDGTAIDARPILHAADRRGVKLRYEYSKRAPDDEPNRDPDYIPPFERGQKLDDHLSRLRTALGTALEECRVQEIGDHPDEDFDPWGYDKVDNDPDVEGLSGQDRRDLLSQSSALNDAIDDTSESAAKVLNVETEASDRFLRNLRSLKNLNLITTAEASFNKGKSRINDTLQRALESKPKILEATADAIQVTVDVAKPLHKTWKEIKKDKFGFVLAKAEQLSLYFRQQAYVLTPPPLVDPDVQEAAEARAAELLKANRPVPDEIAENVRELNLGLTDFQDGELLTNLRWLQKLYLYDTSIQNVSSLTGLTHLVKLDLQGTNITDVTSLASLTNLQRLYLSHTQITDLTAFTSLTNLHSLDLSGTQITDVTPLVKLKELTFLDLGGTHISDWTPVAHVRIVRGRPDDWERQK